MRCSTERMSMRRSSQASGRRIAGAQSCPRDAALRGNGRSRRQEQHLHRRDAAWERVLHPAAYLITARVSEFAGQHFDIFSHTLAAASQRKRTKSPGAPPAGERYARVLHGHFIRMKQLRRRAGNGVSRRRDPSVYPESSCGPHTPVRWSAAQTGAADPFAFH